MKFKRGDFVRFNKNYLKQIHSKYDDLVAFTCIGVVLKCEDRYEGGADSYVRIYWLNDKSSSTENMGYLVKIR